MNEEQNEQPKIYCETGTANDGNTLLSAVPDLTKVWEQVIEKYHGKDAYEQDRCLDALWLLEQKGFIQLKFGSLKYKRFE